MRWIKSGDGYEVSAEMQGNSIEVSIWWGDSDKPIRHVINIPLHLVSFMRATESPAYWDLAFVGNDGSIRKRLTKRHDGVDLDVKTIDRHISVKLSFALIEELRGEA